MAFVKVRTKEKKETAQKVLSLFFGLDLEEEEKEKKKLFEEEWKYPHEFELFEKSPNTPEYIPEHKYTPEQTRQNKNSCPEGRQNHHGCPHYELLIHYEPLTLSGRKQEIRRCKLLKGKCPLVKF
jgi:hypothetical protein